jgi:hypothetical protein
MPRLDLALDLSPVDYVSSAIVTISRVRRACGDTYHVVNPQPIHLREVVKWFRDAGLHMEEVPFASWRAQVVQRAAKFSEEDFCHIAGLLTDAAVEQAIVRAPRGFQCSRTFAALAGSKVTCPPADAGLLSTYLGSLISRQPPGSYTATDSDWRHH